MSLKASPAPGDRSPGGARETSAQGSNGAPLDALVLAYDYPPGHDTGMGTHVAELVRGLGPRGVRPTVVVRHRSDLAVASGSTREQGAQGSSFDVHRVSHGPVTRELLAAPVPDPAAVLLAHNADIEAFARGLVAGGYRPSLLHCHDFFLIPAALRLKAALGVPLVVTVHFLFEPTLRWFGQPVLPGIAELERSMCREADAVITVSHSMADIISSTHGLPVDGVHVVHNGFDTAAFERLAPEPAAAVPEHLRIPDGDRLVVYAGRIAPQKGVSALVASAEQVLAACPNVTYLLAGPTSPFDAAYQDQVRCRVAEAPLLRRKVRLLGKLPREELAGLYRRAALAVVPSLYEPFGYAATEAMALGVPVVASRAGGLTEILEDGDSGLLVATQPGSDGCLALDVEALAAAQLTLLSDDEKARALGARGAERIRSAFTLGAMIQATARVYRSVTSAP